MTTLKSYDSGFLKNLKSYSCGFMNDFNSNKGGSIIILKYCNGGSSCKWREVRVIGDFCIWC